MVLLVSWATTLNSNINYLNRRWFNTISTEWNWSFILLSKKYFAFFSDPASHALLGLKQTYRTENDLPKIF